MPRIDISQTPNNGHLIPQSNLDGLKLLISAAIVSPKFRNQLLADPETAITSGYQGESFHLNTDDKEWALSVHASSLVDLAVQLQAYQTRVKRDSVSMIPMKTLNIPAASSL